MSSERRVTIATRRDRKSETCVLDDTLPALREGEVRLRVDKVGLSANNVFYAQMAEAPLLKFASAYPVAGRPELMHVPAWGIGTVTASANPDVAVGRRFRGFLHLASAVQLGVRATADGFVASDPHRRGLVRAYNTFFEVPDVGSSLSGEGERADLALSSAPSALSGYILAELLQQKQLYGADAVALTSASSKIALSAALCLAPSRAVGTRVIGYTSASNASFVRATGLYDDVVLYDQPLPGPLSRQHVLVDVAGDVSAFRLNRDRIAKALAVGGTQGSTRTSTFAAFRPSGLLKLAAALSGSARLEAWAESSLHPQLEMFFAPSVMADLIRRHGKVEFDRRCDAALGAFADHMVAGGHIRVLRCESPAAVQVAYRRIFEGSVPPTEALLVALPAPTA